MLLRQQRFGFTFSFQDRLLSHLAAILDGCEIGSFKFGRRIMSKCLANYVKYNMMLSSNGNIFRVTGPLLGEFSGHRWIPLKKPVTRNFDVFFDLRQNKRLSKPSTRWWLRRHRTHYGVTVMIVFEMMAASIMSHCGLEHSQISVQGTLLASRVMLSWTTF